ncbi:aminoglycoside phosphotransferase family protein [uncultured Ruegeria sp.]|uniref:aminoglycoside phosphotransferase family protein n=1 Tax=uncultured Ruegeria sp. TaxID=259304 RepID=UPI002621F665|nr:aminoglycoside phosphotransferase family protein [uncultured Ruegeria sp.]
MQDAPQEFLDRWALIPLGVVADTGAARVWKVQQADGTHAALKLYRRADRGNEAPGTQLLSAWRDRGAVRILEVAENAVLMEWLDGPTVGDIARSGQPDKAVQSLADTARCLHHRPMIDCAGLKPLALVFAPLFECRFAKTCPASLAKDMKRAISLARDLLDKQTVQVPLHGDLHHDNVIQTQTGPRAIDAKGYLGDSAFELANALRHPKGMKGLVRQTQQIEQCLTLYADAMAVPRQRLAKWAAAKCALSMFWRASGLVTEDAEADLLRLLLKAADQ